MGGAGSDIAVDAADNALVDDEVKELPHLFALPKRMMTTIRINLGFRHRFFPIFYWYLVLSTKITAMREHSGYDVG